MSENIEHMSDGPADNVERAMPFIHVADMQSSVDFYVTGLGFEVTNRWEPDGELRWCQLEQGGGALMLQASDARPRGSVDIYFICRDAIELYRKFRSNGVDAKRPFVGNAMWVTGVVDPNGVHVFFESPTEEAEESVYEDG